MDSETEHSRNGEERASTPILLVPYVWIGDFVRCHTVVRVLRQRWPARPIDVLSSSLCAPLADYMPGVRRAIVYDLPRSRIAIRQQLKLAALLRREGYGDALIMPRTWKSALAPALAGIATRTGFVGEARFGLLNDWRGGEKALPRMVDRCAALALPAGAALPASWPVPELRVSSADAAAWRRARGLGDRRAVALAPGAVGPSKRWSYFGEAARALAERGLDVWVLGGSGETKLAAEIAEIGGPKVRNLTSNDLRNAILALASCELCISNDSGLLHVAAAVGARSIGIFGPTSPYHWAPLNPIEAAVETRTEVSCRPCHKPECRMQHHRCMRDIAAVDVLTIADATLRKAMATSEEGPGAHNS
jgi:heptosyltransferase-2